MRYLKRFLFLLVMLSVVSVSAQDTAPTLTPPTPIPRPDTTETDATLSASGVTRIVESGVLRVGILYNEPPFAELILTGEVTGYEADVARALAAAWNVELELVQVTRQNRVQRLRQGEVDLLMAALPHERSLDGQLEFSQTYRLGKQAVMIRAEESGIVTLINLANRSVGYVVGTEGEYALRDYLQATGLPIQTVQYLTYDRALSGLFAGEVQGIAGRRERLLRVASTQLDTISIMDEALRTEPFAIAMQRQDVNLRNLVNRTLHYLLEEGTLESLHEEYFPGEDFPFDAMPQWNNIGEEAPQPSQYLGDVVIPQAYVIPRLQNQGVLRVAGAQELESLPPTQQTIQLISQEVVQQIASRWGVRVEFVAGDPLALVESGQADLAIGQIPDWNLANRVDFSQPYMMHGDRLMVPESSGISSFVELRGNPYIAIAREDTGVQERASAWAESVNRRVRFFTTGADSITLSILEDLNANVAFGDTLYLLPQLAISGGGLTLTPRWYTRNFVVMALPRNDVEFRLLVNYTLQELVRDGTLRTILQPVTPPDESPPEFDMWPGSSSFLGFSLG